MSDKDKILLKNSVFAILDPIVNTLDETIAIKIGIPSGALVIAWNLAKGLFGSGIALRQQRAIEWIEMIRENINILTREVLEDEQFQDGFVFMLQKFISERNEERRKVLKNIFLDFVCSTNKEEFDIERYSHTISQLSKEDIFILKDFTKSNISKKYLVYNKVDSQQKIESICNLVNLGILIEGSIHVAQIDVQYPASLSVFGGKFIEFLTR
jgi:hypothetical protein